jgi:hypothetical protein
MLWRKFISTELNHFCLGLHCLSFSFLLLLIALSILTLICQVPSAGYPNLTILIFLDCLLPANQIIIPSGTTLKGLSQLLDSSIDELETFLTGQLGMTFRSQEEVVPQEAAELAAMEWGHIAILVQGQDGEGVLEAALGGPGTK